MIPADVSASTTALALTPWYLNTLLVLVNAQINNHASELDTGMLKDVDANADLSVVLQDI